MNEELITEKVKIKINSLSRETKKYYDFIMKKLPKYEEKAKDKAKYRGTYNELKSRAADLKTIYNKASKLENKFSESASMEEKSKLKREYKELGRRSKDILEKSKKEFNKLKSLLISGGMTAAAAAGVFALADVYDDYMHSFTRFINFLAYPTKPESFLDKIGDAIAWKIYTEETDDNREIIAEGIKFFKGSKALDHYLKIYYKKTPKLRIKVEKLGEEKAKKAAALLKDIDKNIEEIKVMKNELAELENKFSSVKSKEEKEKLKKEYKEIYIKNKPLTKKIVKQTDKLNHTYLKYTLAGAGVYYLIQVARGINKTMEDLSAAFDEYMDELKFNKFDMGPAVSASVVSEEVNYFPY